LQVQNPAVFANLAKSDAAKFAAIFAGFLKPITFWLLTIKKQ